MTPTELMGRTLRIEFFSEDELILEDPETGEQFEVEGWGSFTGEATFTVRRRDPQP